MQYHDTFDTQTVKMILDEKFAELEAKGKELKIFKDWVILRIQSEVSWSRLHNKIQNYKPERSDAPSDDGSRNIRIGADKVFRDCMKSMTKFFDLVDGWVYKVEEDQEAEESDSAGLIFFEGDCRSIPEWSVAKGLPVATLRQRLARGWTIKDALTEPLMRKNARWRKLYDVVPDTWITKENLKALHEQAFSESELLKFGKQRINSEEKYNSWKNQRKGVSKDRLLARGASFVFNNDLSLLRSRNLIEEDDQGRVRRA